MNFQLYLEKKKKVKKLIIFFFLFLIKKIINSTKDNRIPTGLSDAIVPQIKAKIIKLCFLSSNK